MGLNHRQQVFVNEYVKCWNAAESARRAGYNGKSNVIGSQLLANLSISEEIQKRVDEIKMSADEVLIRLANMARSNISDYAKVRTPDDLAGLGDKGQVVKKFKRRITTTQSGNEYEEIELELYDAQPPLQLIGKQHGLFTDKIEVKLSQEIESILSTLEQTLDADSFKRALQALSTRGINSPISSGEITETEDIG